MILCTPNNPSGRRLTAAELMIVSAVAEEHDLLVITDEVYQDIYFGSAPHIAPATIGNLGEENPDDIVAREIVQHTRVAAWLRLRPGKADPCDQGRGRRAGGMRADSAAGTGRAGAQARGRVLP